MFAGTPDAYGNQIRNVTVYQDVGGAWTNRGNFTHATYVINADIEGLVNQTTRFDVVVFLNYTFADTLDDVEYRTRLYISITGEFSHQLMTYYDRSYYSDEFNEYWIAYYRYEWDHPDTAKAYDVKVEYSAGSQITVGNPQDLDDGIVGGVTFAYPGEDNNPVSWTGWHGTRKGNGNLQWWRKAGFRPFNNIGAFTISVWFAWELQGSSTTQTILSASANKTHLAPTVPYYTECENTTWIDNVNRGGASSDGDKVTITDDEAPYDYVQMWETDFDYTVDYRDYINITVTGWNDQTGANNYLRLMLPNETSNNFLTPYIYGTGYYEYELNESIGLTKAMYWDYRNCELGDYFIVDSMYYYTNQTDGVTLNIKEFYPNAVIGDEVTRIDVTHTTKLVNYQQNSSNTLYHAVVSWDKTNNSGKVDFWIDNVLVTSDEGLTSNVEANYNFRLGGFNYSSIWYFFVGRMFHVAIYDRALNRSEVNRLYQGLPDYVIVDGLDNSWTFEEANYGYNLAGDPDLHDGLGAFFEREQWDIDFISRTFADSIFPWPYLYPELYIWLFAVCGMVFTSSFAFYNIKKNGFWDRGALFTIGFCFVLFLIFFSLFSGM